MSEEDVEKYNGPEIVATSESGECVNETDGQPTFQSTVLGKTAK